MALAISTAVKASLNHISILRSQVEIHFSIDPVCGSGEF